MSSRPRLAKGLWASVRNKTLKKKSRKTSAELENQLCLGPTDVEVLLGRMRVILAHVEGNAEPNDILFLSAGGLSPDAKEAAKVLVEALENDDTLYLVKSLQRYSCATLSSVIKLTFMSCGEPLIPGKVCRLIINTCGKYAEFLHERDDEKVEEIGATLERFSEQSSLDVLEGLCQSLKRLPMPNDELAYIFAPLVLLPKIGMLSDESLPEEELVSNFELLADADAVIEAMEFMIENATVLFDSRSRKRALLKKGLSQQFPVFDIAAEGSDEEEEEEHVERIHEEELPQNDEASSSDDRSSSNGGSNKQNRLLGTKEEETKGDDPTSEVTPPALSVRVKDRIVSINRRANVTNNRTSGASTATTNTISDITDDEEEEEEEEEEMEDEIEEEEEDDEDALSSADMNSFHSKEPVCYATALFDYEPVEDGEIGLVRGEHVQVLEIEDDGWWYGRNKDGLVGVFPGVYVQKIEPSGDALSVYLEKFIPELEKRLPSCTVSANSKVEQLAALLQATLARLDTLEEENAKFKSFFVISPNGTSPPPMK